MGNGVVRPNRAVTFFRNMPTHRLCGLSMVELLIVMVIVAIIAAIAVPNGRSMLANRLIATTANALLTSSEQARATAVSRGMVVYLCPSPDGERCGSASSWNSGWITWADVNDNNVLDNNVDEILVIKQFESNNLSLNVPAAVGAGYHFRKSGRPSFSTQNTITVCDSDGTIATARAVIFTITGRGSVLPAEDVNNAACART